MFFLYISKAEMNYEIMCKLTDPSHSHAATQCEQLGI